MNNFLRTFYKILFANSILYNIFYALIYIVLFDYIWEHYEAVYFAYSGVIYISDFSHRMEGYFYALYPILFFRGLRNASSWVAIMLYYFGYVPMIMGLCLDIPLNSSIDIQSYYIVLSIAMSSFFLADDKKIVLRRKSQKKLPPKYLWNLTIIFTIILLVTFSGNMRIVNFTEIYQLRKENSSVDVAGIGYIYSWCANFFYPLVFCTGLLRNNKKLIVIGISLFLLLFSIMGQKSDFFAPLILYVLYRTVIWVDKYRTNIMAPISLGILLLSIFLFSRIESDSVYEIAGLFFSRTLGVSAYHVPMYLNFFEHNPYTYFSHINIINAITNMYPYTQSIGEMVAGDGSNSNAIFWLMDGVAGCGVYGVMLISVVVYFFLLFLNGICNEKNKYFIYTMMLIPMVALVNVSFFTTVLSKGILFLFLTVWFINIPLEKNVRKVYNQ